MRIREKFELLVGGLVLLIALGTASAVFWIERRSAIESLDQEQARQIKTFSAVCQQSLALSDTLFLINYLKVLKALPGISWAYYADEQDKILVHTDERYYYQPLSSWEHAGARGDTIEMSEPVLFRGQPRGRARIGFSRAFRDDNVVRAVMRTLESVAAVAVVAGTLGLLAAIALALFMTRPIHELAQATQRIAKGELDLTLPVRSGDELGELTAQFNAMSRRLKELDDLKEEFIAMVSHDLRGPLGAIKMYLDYLLMEVRGPLNAEQKDIAAVCISSANRLGLFINNILDSAKVKAGRLEYHFAPFKLSEALQPVLDLSKIAAAHNKLQVQIPDLGTAPLVQGDRERIEHVFNNLLSNAIKHTPEGGWIDVRWQGDGSGKLRVTIENPGRGIPKEQLEHLFERFYQADIKTQKELHIKGTGLGLSIVKETIEKHGGKVWVESEPNKTTRFHFLIPLCEQRQT